MLDSAVMRKNADIGELLDFVSVYSGNYYYAIHNFGWGEYRIENRFDPESDKDKIKSYERMIENGRNNKNNERINEEALGIGRQQSVRSRRDNMRFAEYTNGQRHTRNDRLYRRQPNSDKVTADKESDRNSQELEKDTRRGVKGNRSGTYQNKTGRKSTTDEVYEAVAAKLGGKRNALIITCKNTTQVSINI